MEKLSRNHGKYRHSEYAYSNPMIRKLARLDETSEECVTFEGVAKKTGYFLAMILTGVILTVILQAINPIVVEANGEIIDCSLTAILMALVCLVLVIVTPLLAFIIKRTIPVTGALFCLSVGYLATFAGFVAPELRGYVVLALVLTVMIAAVMLFVYVKRIIKVDSKFRKVIRIAFFSSIASSLLLLVCALVPQLRPIVEAFANEPILTPIVSLLYIVIASFALLVDFDTIEMAIKKKLPVKYEWYASFGLMFSLIWLFLRLLELLMQAKGDKKN